jgi:hypothetical protein
LTFDRKEDLWARLLACVTGLINRKLLLKNEYLAAENRTLRAHLPACLRLSDPERSTLAEIGKRLGRIALGQVACGAKPDTILAWYRKVIAKKFDGSKHRRYPGRPPIEPTLEKLIVKMARENTGWGHDRIVGALANLGYTVSDQTVGNVLKRRGMAPAVLYDFTPTRERAGPEQFLRNYCGYLQADAYVAYDMCMANS